MDHITVLLRPVDYPFVGPAGDIAPSDPASVLSALLNIKHA